SSRRTAPSRTGANSSATPRPSPRCSTGSSTMRTYSRVAPRAGGLGSTPIAPPPAHHDAARAASERHDLEGGRYLGIPRTDVHDAAAVTFSIPIERGRTLVLGAARRLAGFPPSTTGRFSGVHRGQYSGTAARSGQPEHPMPLIDLTLK